MRYINIKSFRNKDEFNKSIEREYFDGLYKKEDNYEEKMEMFELSLDLEPNMIRINRYFFVLGLTTAKLIVNKLENMADDEIKMSLTIEELNKAKQNLELNSEQEEYFKYGVFAGIVVINNEKNKPSEKVFK